MEKGSCIVLIGEDEEIERLFLKHALEDNFREELIIYTAKNGLEALELYKQYHPDIVLMDINMPGLNGLQAIAKMKVESPNTYYIILTSYDYFRYAQEAIRLGVENFILKPSTTSAIIEAVSQGFANVHTAHNEEAQKSNLVQKYNEMRLLLEKQCFYSIISGAKEMVLQEEFKRLNIVIKEGFCIVINSDEQNGFQTFKEDIEDIGYVCLQQYLNHMYVNFILSNRKLQETDLELIEYMLVRHKLQSYKVGIGSIQSISDGLANSYMQGIRNQHVYEKSEPYHIIHAKVEEDHQKMDITAFGDALLAAFMRQKEEDLQIVIHEYSVNLINKGIEEIKEIVGTIVEYLIERLESLLHQTIDRENLPEFRLSEEEIYQSLEAQLYYLFHNVFHPLQALRYQQSSILVKRALQYIHKNYNKTISLNDLAKHLQVTPFYVSKLLKQHTGNNFTDIVSAERIEKAKELLHEHQRVKEVAFAVGFQSQSYFAKMFKKTVGITPREYQESFM